MFDQLAYPNSGLHYHAFFVANQGKYDDAEPLYKRALAIREETLGPRHPDAAFTGALIEILRSPYEQPGVLLHDSQVMWH